MIEVVIVSDRADLYLPDCLRSLADAWPYHPAPIIVDDRLHRLGMAGAVRQGWEQALARGADFVLHVEEDFRFSQPIPIDKLQFVLERCPDLAQVVLKRQPWNEQEKAAGGIIEANPDAYVEHRAFGRNVVWSEHWQIFSLNPCLIPRRVLELGWPDGNEAEFTKRCVDEGLHFAFYGAKADPPLVEHVGHQRAQGWRL